jgi:hypothetical protein
MISPGQMTGLTLLILSGESAKLKDHAAKLSRNKLLAMYADSGCITGVIVYVALSAENMRVTLQWAGR